MKRAGRKTAVKTTARAKRPKKTKPTLKFLEKPDCPTCQKASRFLQKRGYKLNYRDIIKDPLNVSELEKLIGTQDHEEFLRPRSSLFQKLKMGSKPPSRQQAIKLMAKNPELIRRPLVVAGGRVVIGYDEDGMIRF
jgi:Spx/MgsR family transcriptional regulator